MTQSPTGCNPNTPTGDTPGTQTVLGARAAQPVRDVVNAAGTPTSNSDADRVRRAGQHQSPDHRLHPEPQGGVVRRRAHHRGRLQVRLGAAARRPGRVRPTEVASIAGYRDIASVTGSNGGHTVTVKFKTTFADWQMLFANLVPAHVMEKVGWNPTCAHRGPGHRPVGRPVQDRRRCRPRRSRWCRTPKWWGTPANARSITIHIASSTEQLAQWMASGYVQVAQPTTVTQSFLTQMTGLPGAQSEVDTSATLLQLDMASSLDSDLSPDLRVAIALTINRQDLVNQQVSWAVPGIAPWQTATSPCRASRTTSRPRRAHRRRRSRRRRRRPRPR